MCLCVFVCACSVPFPKDQQSARLRVGLTPITAQRDALRRQKESTASRGAEFPILRLRYGKSDVIPCLVYVYIRHHRRCCMWIGPISVAATQCRTIGLVLHILKKIVALVWAYTKLEGRFSEQICVCANNEVPVIVFCKFQSAKSNQVYDFRLMYSFKSYVDFIFNQSTN